jgi:hypothetical protein
MIAIQTKIRTASIFRIVSSVNGRFSVHRFRHPVNLWSPSALCGDDDVVFRGANLLLGNGVSARGGAIEPLVEAEAGATQGEGRAEDDRELHHAIALKTSAATCGTMALP